MAVAGRLDDEGARVTHAGRGERTQLGAGRGGGREQVRGRRRRPVHRQVDHPDPTARRDPGPDQIERRLDARARDRVRIAARRAGRLRGHRADGHDRRAAEHAGHVAAIVAGADDPGDMGGVGVASDRLRPRRGEPLGHHVVEIGVMAHADVHDIDPRLPGRDPRTADRGDAPRPRIAGGGHAVGPQRRQRHRLIGGQPRHPRIDGEGRELVVVEVGDDAVADPARRRDRLDAVGVAQLRSEVTQARAVVRRQLVGGRIAIQVGLGGPGLEVDDVADPGGGVDEPAVAERRGRDQRGLLRVRVARTGVRRTRARDRRSEGDSSEDDSGHANSLGRRTVRRRRPYPLGRGARPGRARPVAATAPG